MLDGEKPSGCQYCWNVESLGEDYISDRKKELFLYINQTQKELMRLSHIDGTTMLILNT